jgi:hypothetical protein
MTKRGSAAVVAVWCLLSAGCWSSLEGHKGSPRPSPTPSAAVAESPSPSPTMARPFHPFDVAGFDLRYPGGIARIGEHRWLVVYERFLGDTPVVYARETSDLLGPFGPPTPVSDPTRESFDPGAALLADGTVVVTWSSEAAVWASVRLRAGHYSSPRALFTDPGGRAAEQTLMRISGTTFLTYDYHPLARPEDVWDVRLRRVGSGPSTGPFTTIVSEGPGLGVEGRQRRVTIAPTGEPQGLIAVWSQHPDPLGGPRSIYGALSSDFGATWGQPFPVAAFPGHDLVNPFAVQASRAELRVYFTQDQHVPGLGYVVSTDHGRTWGGLVHVAGIAPGVQSARVVVQKDPAHGLVAFVSANDFTELGTYVLDPLAS